MLFITSELPLPGLKFGKSGSVNFKDLPKSIRWFGDKSCLFQDIEHFLWPLICWCERGKIRILLTLEGANGFPARDKHKFCLLLVLLTRFFVVWKFSLAKRGLTWAVWWRNVVNALSDQQTTGSQHSLTMCPFKRRGIFLCFALFLLFVSLNVQFRHDKIATNIILYPLKTALHQKMQSTATDVFPDPLFFAWTCINGLSILCLFSNTIIRL